MVPLTFPGPSKWGGELVHPTFLYESIWCFILFFVLLYIDNHRQFYGQTCLSYGVLYSIERFFVEGLRTDSLMIGPFRTAQVVSLTLIVVCSVAYVILKKRATAPLALTESEAVAGEEEGESDADPR